MAERPCYVYEDSFSYNRFDIVCPACCTVVETSATGESQTFSQRCPGCTERLYHYSAMVVPEGKANRYSESELRRELKDYWRRAEHDKRARDDFKEAAYRLGIMAF